MLCNCICAAAAKLLLYLCFILNTFFFSLAFTESPQTQQIRLENERLQAEISRLKKLLEGSGDGAVGGIDASDTSSYEVRDANEEGSCRIEKLENELRIAKELIQSK